VFCSKAQPVVQEKHKQERIPLRNKKRSLLLLLAGVLVLLGTPIHSLATTVTVKLTGVNGATQGGVYADPYYGTINKGSQVVLVCDDFNHETDIGESWQATVSTFADLNSVRFKQNITEQTLQDYEEAAYLYNQLLSHPSQYGDISFALWALFSPNARNSSGFTPNSQNWLSKAQLQTFYAGEFSNFLILTPVSHKANSPQEFLTTTATPEPSSVLLLMSGLAAVSLLWRKKLLA
jgi:hypothetical protein